MTTMQPVKAHVKNGRLVLDEPTDRPEGEEVELVALDEILAHGGDDLGRPRREDIARQVTRSSPIEWLECTRGALRLSPSKRSSGPFEATSTSEAWRPEFSRRRATTSGTRSGTTAT